MSIFRYPPQILQQSKLALKITNYSLFVKTSNKTERVTREKVSDRTKLRIKK